MSDAFLSKVEALNEYCSIEIDTQLESIALPFWSLDEIKQGLKRREEWGVPSHLIPFQGDWHDLLCLDQDTGKVVYLNNDRDIVFSWENTQEFLNALSKEEVARDTTRKITSAWIDPDF
ncbi:cell wall assembly protein [Alkalilimnicola ehrlichii]|uniref:Cell wall assembly protein n=1 Tax=Alkalilimnicola ehrlichii TaxID=351052 RepID=A0A3E0WI36_9GAMM|nr:SMI1/KNR4 family protein [Alkalilimnicola ehrlichii]RFA26606.1 cell wall assembly protein [Alkalilimnicola ehrlichii]RFA31883.1 cell wall assembly protein [Alkalilimnicola ehrlichii]